MVGRGHFAFISIHVRKWIVIPSGRSPSISIFMSVRVSLILCFSQIKWKIGNFSLCVIQTNITIMTEYELFLMFYKKNHFSLCTLLFPWLDVKKGFHVISCYFSAWTLDSPVYESNPSTENIFLALFCSRPCCRWSDWFVATLKVKNPATVCWNKGKCCLWALVWRDDDKIKR